MRLQTSKGQDSRPVVSFSSQKQASEFSSMLGLPCHRFLFLQYLFLPCEQQVLAPSQHPHPLALPSALPVGSLGPAAHRTGAVRGLHLPSSSSRPLVLPRRAQHTTYSSAVFEMARQEEEEDHHRGMEQMSAVVENGGLVFSHKMFSCQMVFIRRALSSRRSG